MKNFLPPFACMVSDLSGPKKTSSQTTPNQDSQPGYVIMEGCKMG